MLWSPFSLFDDVEPLSHLRDVERDFRTLFRAQGASRVGDYPSVSIWSNSEVATLLAEIPGVSPAEVDVSVMGRTVTIKGERLPHAPEQGEVVLRRERQTGSFARTFELPFDIQAERVTAEFANGVLTVKLPKSEAHRPMKVSVKAN